MQAPTTLISLALALFPATSLAMPATSPNPSLHPRALGPVRGAYCSGCGGGLASREKLQELVDQVNTSKRYDVPWTSAKEAGNWHGITSYEPDLPTFATGFETPEGYTDWDTKGTICGDMMKVGLQGLVDGWSDLQHNCISFNGQYVFTTGNGLSCSG